jgi:hypothetical protein
MEKIVIDIGEVNLVVEKYDNAELCVYLEDKKTNCVTQDIVTVRQAIKDDEPLHNTVDCLVWADESDENYTHKFTIPHLEEDELSDG